MASNIADDSEKHRLCDFPRSKDGARDRLRIESNHWNGRINLGFRIWFQATRPTEGDDGYRPSKCGFAIRECEVDEVIEALEYHRRLIHAEGRSTSSGHPGAVLQPRIIPSQQPSSAPSSRPQAQHTGPARDRLVSNLPARYQRSGSPRPETGDRNSAPWEPVGDDVF